MCGHTEILHQNNKRFFLDNIKKVVMDTLKILREKSIEELKEERYMKFRELGEFSE